MPLDGYEADPMRTSQPPDSSRSGRALLRTLLSSDENSRAAWEKFLRRYTGLILEIAWEFESDYDAVMETYEYVCRRLAEDDFARLRSYDPTRGETPAKVSTWLAVVVQNLCLEHQRRKEGRRRYPKPVIELSEFDQKVFELYFWEDYTAREVAQVMEASSEYESDSVGPALQRLWALHQESSQNWNEGSFRPDAAFEENRHSQQVVDVNGPSSADQRGWISSLLGELPDEERLAVRWSYWCGVSASDIGRLLQIPQRKVYTLLNRALRKMRRRVGAEGGERRTDS